MVKSHPHFRLEISFDARTEEPVAAYLQLRQGAVEVTKEVENGIAFADYDAEGNLLGIELLESCPFDVIDRLIQSEPSAMRRFIYGVAPHRFIR